MNERELLQRIALLLRTGKPNDKAKARSLAERVATIRLAKQKRDEQTNAQQTNLF